MKNYLHIGPHKTGTSYIQKNFSLYRNLMLSHKIIYPELWILGGYGHAGLVDHNKISSFNEDLSNYLKENKFDESSSSIFISTENFDRLGNEEICNLSKSALPNTHIIFFHRRYDKLLYSNWQEDVKFGVTKTFKVFLLENFSNINNSKYINQALILDEWSNVFGKSHIKIFDYDYLLNNNLDIFLFMTNKLFSISKIENFNSMKENSSFSLFEAEILRCLHSLNKEFKLHETIILTKIYYSMLSKNDSLLMSMKEKLKSHIKQFRDFNLSDIKILYDNFWLKYSKEALTDKSNFIFEDLNYISESWLESDQLFNMLKDIYFLMGSYAKDS
jgi:hypothetical protein